MAAVVLAPGKLAVEEADDSVQVTPGEEYSGRKTLRLPETLKASVEARLGKALLVPPAQAMPSGCAQPETQRDAWQTSAGCSPHSRSARH